MGVNIILLITLVLYHNSTDLPIPQYKTDCQNICISNNLKYLKTTNSGYGQATYVCYCQSIDNKISTYLL
jgi:hypothetical protein